MASKRKPLRRSAPARALAKPQHRQRVVPNKKKSRTRSKSLADLLSETRVLIKDQHTASDDGMPERDVPVRKLVKPITAISPLVIDNPHNQLLKVGSIGPEYFTEDNGVKGDWRDVLPINQPREAFCARDYGESAKSLGFGLSVGMLACVVIIVLGLLAGAAHVNGLF